MASRKRTARPALLITAATRTLCQEVDTTAWAVLTDVALDAEVDTEGLLVADTNVQRIAAHLAISKTAPAELWLVSLTPGSSSASPPGVAPLGGSLPRATSYASTLTPASPS